jgi:exonuclease SbcC
VTVLDDEARRSSKPILTEARTTAERLTTESQAATKQLGTISASTRPSSPNSRSSPNLVVKQLQTSQVGGSAEVSKAKALADEAKQQRTKREPVWEQAAGLAAQSDQLEKQLGESRATYQTWAKEQKEAASRREAAEKSARGASSRPRRRWKRG